MLCLAVVVCWNALSLSLSRDISLSYLSVLQRLKHQTPRQVDINFEGLIQKFQERQRQYERLVARERENEEERCACVYVRGEVCVCV